MNESCLVCISSAVYAGALIFTVNSRRAKQKLPIGDLIQACYTYRGMPELSFNK